MNAKPAATPAPGQRPPEQSSHIVFATTGSLGDVYPFIALALGMQARGHLCTIATSPLYRETIESVGLRFARMAPDLSDDPGFIEKAWDPKNRTFLFEEIMKPAMEQSYHDILAIEPKPDLLVARGFVYSAPLIAEMTGVPWIATKLFVAECVSAYDLPHRASLAPFMRALGRRSAVKRWLADNFRSQFQKRYLGPIKDMRERFGLAPSTHYRYWGSAWPQLDLVLFSSILGEPQPDWPSFARQAGFLFRDDVLPAPPLSPELEAFLAEGAPPLVFTFGSQQFGRRNQNFLQVSMEAALRLGQRAVLLTGGGANRAVLPDTLPKGILAVDQAWHGGLFPRASVVVNHCGVGTAAVALRAGRPQLGVPVSVDQPDNARRLVERGLALAIDDRKYTAERATKALGRLLSEPSFTRKAQEAAAAIAAEQGLERACDMLEDVLVGERRAFAAA